MKTHTSFTSVIFLPFLLALPLVACDDSSDTSSNSSTGGTNAMAGANAGGMAGDGSNESGGTGGDTSNGASGGSAGSMAGSAGMGGTAAEEWEFQGKVVDGAGAGIENAKVLLEGNVYTTDDEGAFYANDINDTYDLIVLPPGDEKTVSVWKDATRRDPVAIVPVEHEVPSATVKGSVAGGGFPYTAPMSLLIGFDCSDGRRVLSQPLTTEDFEIEVSWAKWGPGKCQLMVLEVIGSIGLTAYASQKLSLTDGEELVLDEALTLGTVPPNSTSVAIENMAGPYGMNISWGPFPAVYSSQVSMIELHLWQVQAPDLGIPVSASFTKDGKRGARALPTGGIHIPFGAAISGINPVAETITPDAEFSVTLQEPQNGLFEFAFGLESGTRVILHTAEDTVRLPDLSAFEIDVLGETKWSAEFSDATLSIDAALGEPGFLGMTLESTEATVSIQEAP